MNQILNFYQEEKARVRKQEPTNMEYAKLLLSSGHVLAEQKFYVNAIEEYNKALCYTPTDSCLLGPIFANRAEVFLKLKLFSECVASIKLAKKSACSDVLLDKLNQMRTVCRRSIISKTVAQKGEDKLFKVILSHSANERIPFVIDSIRVEEDSQFGRYLITDISLTPGDVICIEEDFTKCLQPQQRYTICTNCIRELPHRLFPCESCKNAMFCSDVCRDSAWTRFHRHECGISGPLMSSSMESGRLALRTFFVVMNSFGDNIEALRQFLNENTGKINDRLLNPFDLDYRDVCPKQQFLVFLNGHQDDSHQSTDAKVADDRCAITLTALLEHTCDFAGQLQGVEIKMFLIGLFRKMIRINANNCYELTNDSANERRSSVCLGSYLCMSMASHSCIGNVARMQVEATKQMWVVTRPIRAGGQIFDNYGSFYETDSRTTRQNRCWKHYGFKCQCEACENNYPRSEEETKAKGIPEPSSVKIRPKSDLTIQSIQEDFTALRDFLTEYHSAIPCRQLSRAKTALLTLFETINSEPSLEYRFPNNLKP